MYTCLRNVENPNVKKFFNYKFSLTGHLDSIKDFAFTSSNFTFENEVQYLASCSQDNNIRLWKIQPLENIQKEIEVDTKNEIDEQDIK